jgi:hypothetical protein
VSGAAATPAEAKPSPIDLRERELGLEHGRLLQQAWGVERQLEELTQSREILRHRLRAIDAELEGLRFARASAAKRER